MDWVGQELAEPVAPVGPALAVDQVLDIHGAPVVLVGPALAVDWVVVNLSSHRLTSMETVVLQRGLGFHLARPQSPGPLCARALRQPLSH